MQGTCIHVPTWLWSMQIAQRAMLHDQIAMLGTWMYHATCIGGQICVHRGPLDLYSTIFGTPMCACMMPICVHGRSKGPYSTIFGFMHVQSRGPCMHGAPCTWVMHVMHVPSLLGACMMHTHEDQYGAKRSCGSLQHHI